jgi:hypothetical protein
MFEVVARRNLAHERVTTIISRRSRYARPAALR